MNMLIVLGIGIAAVILVSFLVKSFMKFILIGVIAYGLFHVGFIWHPEDLNAKLRLSNFLTPDADKKLMDAYGEFANNREEHAVVNTQEIKRVIDNSIQKGLENAKNQARKVDKQAILDALKTQLQQYDSASLEQAIKDAEADLKKVGITSTEMQVTLKLTPRPTPTAQPTTTTTN